jgi:hypothetical protein
MSEPLNDFLASRLPLPGVLGWSARLADRALLSHAYNDWLSPGRLEQTLTRLALETESLDQHGLQPRRLCWTFEHVRIYLAPRSDGAWLAVFVENNPTLDSGSIEHLLGEFAALQA